MRPLVSFEGRQVSFEGQPDVWNVLPPELDILENNRWPQALPLSLCLGLVEFQPEFQEGGSVARSNSEKARFSKADPTSTECSSEAQSFVHP